MASLGNILSLFHRRTLTVDEQRELKAQRAMAEQVRRREQALYREAESYAHAIPLALKDLGLYSKHQIEVMSITGGKGRRETQLKRIHFRRPFLVTEEAIYLFIDLRPGHRPEGVSWRDLANEDVLRDIGVAIGHKVDSRFDEEFGLRYMIWRNIGARGVPLHVQYDQIWALRPASADRYSIPLGMSEGKRGVWVSLRRMQGLLIAGTTGGGKTNLIKVIMCALIAQNTERNLLLIIADFKIVEFHFFKGLPHLVKYDVDKKGEWIDRETREAYITEPEHMLPALRWLKVEMERRARKIEEDGVTNIVDYNSGRREKRMPDIVLVIDELAEIILHPKYSAECQELIVNLGSKGRAMGIHLVMGTQHPSSKIVEGRLKTVLPAIIAFPMPTISASVMVLGNKAAKEIGERGRAIYQFALEEMELQVPLITDQKVREIVAAAKAGKGYEAEIKADSHDVTDDDIFRWSIEHNDFKLDWRSIVGAFAVRGMSTRPAREFLKSYYGKRVWIEGEEYEVVQGGPGGATKLVKVNDVNTPNDVGTDVEHGTWNAVAPSGVAPVSAEPAEPTDDPGDEESDGALQVSSLMFSPAEEREHETVDHPE